MLKNCHLFFIYLLCLMPFSFANELPPQNIPWENCERSSFKVKIKGLTGLSGHLHIDVLPTRENFFRGIFDGSASILGIDLYEEWYAQLDSHLFELAELTRVKYLKRSRFWGAWVAVKSEQLRLTNEANLKRFDRFRKEWEKSNSNKRSKSFAVNLSQPRPQHHLNYLGPSLDFVSAIFFLRSFIPDQFSGPVYRYLVDRKGKNEGGVPRLTVRLKISKSESELGDNFYKMTMKADPLASDPPISVPEIKNTTLELHLKKDHRRTVVQIKGTLDDRLATLDLHELTSLQAKSDDEFSKLCP